MKDTYIKSNALVQATVNNMTAKQNQLMAIMLTNYVDNFDEDSTIDTITMSRYDILKYLGVNVSGKSYKIINDNIKSMFKNSIVSWIDEKERTENITSIFSQVQIRDYDKEGDSQVIFTWNPLIKPHISNMKKEYTTLITSNFLALKSKKAQSLYEFFHSYLKQEYVTVYVDKLKELTECTSASYKVFKDFYKRGISGPIEEINDKTDIDIEVVSKNKGTENKKVTVSITFRITSSKAKKAWFDEYPTILLTDDEYRTVTQDFNVGGMPVGKKLVNKLAKTKEKKPNQIHNDFKQLEKYYKAELKKYEKEKNQNLATANACDLNFDGLYANTRNDVNEPLPGQKTIFDLGVEDVEKKEKEQEEIFEMLKQYD